MRYPWYLRANLSKKLFDDNPSGALWRYTINLKTEVVSETAIDDLGIELPRIEDSLMGRSYSYLYAAEQPTDEEIRDIVKCNLETGKRQRYTISHYRVKAPRGHNPYVAIITSDISPLSSLAAGKSEHHPKIAEIVITPSHGYLNNVVKLSECCYA